MKAEAGLMMSNKLFDASRPGTAWLWLKNTFSPDEPKPWKPFFYKAVAISLITLAVATAVFTAFKERFEILIDPQIAKCLPNYSVYLVDKNDRNPVRGKPFAFHALGISKYLDFDDDRLDPIRPYYEDGKKILKIVDGIPGDVISITEDAVKVNGENTGVAGLILSKTIQKTPSDFERTITLGANKYYFAGRTYDSFDSRYWGSVDRGQIIGRAYPLF